MDLDEERSSTKLFSLRDRSSHHRSHGSARPARMIEGEESSSDDEDEARETIVDFNADSLSSKKKTIVIPCVGNSWQAGIGRVESSREDAHGTGEANTRVKSTSKAKNDENEMVEDETVSAILAQVRAYEESGGSVLPSFLDVQGSGRDVVETVKLHTDLNALTEFDEEAFSRVPVEDFGDAMLRGMGWQPGKPVGRNATEVVEAIEFIPRHERAGLGADVSGLKKKKRRKIGEEENTRGEMTVAADADGKIRHYRTLDEKLIRRRPTYLAPNAIVSITSGPHAGLFGEVLDVGDSRATIRLSVNNQSESIRNSRMEVLDISRIPSSHPVFRELKTLQIERLGSKSSKSNQRGGSEENDDDNMSNISDVSDDNPLQYGLNTASMLEEAKRDRDKRRVEKRKEKKSKHKKDQGDSSQVASHSGREDSKGFRQTQNLPSASSSSSRHLSAQSDSQRYKEWMFPNLHVRIISRERGKGRYYNRKGTITDVLSPSECMLLVDDSKELLDNVHISELETVIPKHIGPSARVLIVAGKRHRGREGFILEKDKKKAVAVVQLMEDMNVEKFSYDDICELLES